MRKERARVQVEAAGGGILEAEGSDGRAPPHRGSNEAAARGTKRRKTWPGLRGAGDEDERGAA